MPVDQPRTAIITGGSRGLGLALAKGLAADSWRLILDARDGDALHRQAPTGRVRLIPGDITDEHHRRCLVAAIGANHADRDAAHHNDAPDNDAPDNNAAHHNDAPDNNGILHALVLNASTLGQAALPKLADYDLDALRRTLETNVVAQLALVQLALPALRRGRGRIIVVTSDAAVEAYAGWGGYGASKATLEAVARVLAVEEPLRVYAFDPGDLRTQMHQEAFPGEDISDRPEPDTVVPMMRRLLDEDLPSGRYSASQLAESRPVESTPLATSTSTIEPAK